jgi:hypothetical protein
VPKHKHNANEGERCTYKTQKTNSKRPLLFSITTAFILLSPTAAASVALASLSYDTERSPLGVRPQQLTTSQSQVLPKSYRGLSLPASATPSLDDINNLESSIASVQKQLNTLKSILPKDPAQQETLTQTINAAQLKLDTLNTKLAKAKADYSTYLKAQATLTSALSKYDAALLKENNLLLALTQATSEYDAALAALNAQATLTQAARADLETAQTNYTNAQNLYNSATERVQAQELSTANAKSAQEAAQLNYQTAQQELTNATSANTQAQLNLQTAQSNYDNNLISDPDWTAPTYQQERTRTITNTRMVEVRTQVPTTTTSFQEQVIPNLLFNSDFTRGLEGWSGLSIGWQNSQPGYFNSNIVFSYQNQTVSQGLYSGPFNNATLTLSADWFNDDSNRNITDSYSMTVEAKDINQNPVGSATYNSEGRHDWENKSVTLTATGPVSYLTVSFSGIDNGFWAGNYGPRVKNPTLQVSHGQMVTQTTYEEVITYEEEIYYTTETYYTTELVTTEGTLNVRINEGGQATFNAPEGATFISSNLRYEAIDRPTCGKDIAPQLAGLSTITIRALNSVWGDPCGGWYKHITGTLTYLGQPTAPLINDPALLPALLEAQQEATAASQLLTNKEQETVVAREALETAEQAYSEASTELLTNKSKVTEAQEVLNTSSNTFNSAKTTKEQAEQTLSTVQQTEQTTSATKTSTEQQYETAKQETTTSTQEKTLAEETLETATSTALTSYQEVSSEPQPDLTPIQQIIDTEPPLPEPEPEPEPEEQGSAEIPPVIENLMEVNLEAVDPTELTEAQAEQLVEAALVAFETAVEGSPEYEQALDALYLAAEQDDIELPEEFAAIPGLAGAVEVLNFLGNAGADMSPKVREESEKVVVATVVAAGAAIQSAAAAAATASAPSGGSRRVVK